MGCLKFSLGWFLGPQMGFLSCSHLDFLSINRHVSSCFIAQNSLFNQYFEKLQCLSSLPQWHVTSHILIYEVEDLPGSWDLSVLLFSRQNLCNHCGTPDFPVLHYLMKFTQAQVHWVGDAIQPSHPLLSPSPPALNLSHHQFFFPLNESVLPIRWPKYWSFNFSISPSKEYSGLISFRIDWFDLLAVRRTFKSLCQNHSLKASVLQCSAFFMIRLSCPYITTGKTIALTIQTFFSKGLCFLICCLGLS